MLKVGDYVQVVNRSLELHGIRGTIHEVMPDEAFGYGGEKANCYSVLFTSDEPHHSSIWGLDLFVVDPGKEEISEEVR